MNLAQNTKIKKLLKGRWKELDLKDSKIMNDAEERAPHLKFARSRISKWEHGQTGGLTDEQVYWLCVRWGIEINLNFGTPFINTKGGLEWKVEPYSELICLQNLKKIFPKVAVVNKKAAKKDK